MCQSRQFQSSCSCLTPLWGVQDGGCYYHEDNLVGYLTGSPSAQGIQGGEESTQLLMKESDLLVSRTVTYSQVNKHQECSSQLLRELDLNTMILTDCNSAVAMLVITQGPGRGVSPHLPRVQRQACPLICLIYMAYSQPYPCPCRSALLCSLEAIDLLSIFSNFIISITYTNESTEHGLFGV